MNDLTRAAPSLILKLLFDIRGFFTFDSKTNNGNRDLPTAELV